MQPYNLIYFITILNLKNFTMYLRLEQGDYEFQYKTVREMYYLIHYLLLNLKRYI